MIGESNSRRQRLAATSIGDGVVLACQLANLSGVVVGTFTSGFYVRQGETLFAVGGPDIPAGPLHLLLEAPPPLRTEQTLIELGPDRMRFDSFSIDLSRASRHRPNQPTPKLLQTISPTLARLDSWYALPDDVAPVWAKIRCALETADLHRARQLLAGLGSGLTPTGDDVLAGLLLFAHWADPLSEVPGEVAQQAATSDLSRCFLIWAATGQSIQPLHDLIDAATALLVPDNSTCASTANERYTRSIAAVASIGGSSGKGMLAGLGLAASAWSWRQ